MDLRSITKLLRRPIRIRVRMRVHMYMRIRVRRRIQTRVRVRIRTRLRVFRRNANPPNLAESPALEASRRAKVQSLV